MMRWVFAALLLANLGLFMWTSWYRETPGETIAARPVYHPELMVPLNAPGVALRARKNEKAEAPLVVAKPRPRCVTLGPFAPEAADGAAAWLAGEKIEAARRNEERKVESSYWIYLGPFANRKDAERRMRQLARLGIRDLLIMPDAQGANAVSLGLFSRADNAKHRLEELTAKGIEAKQEIRYRTDTSAWFDLRLPEPADEAVERLRRRDWGAAGIEVRDTTCAPEAPPTAPAPAAPVAPAPG